MQENFQKIRQLLSNGSLSHTTLADETGVLLDINGGKVMTLNTTGEFLLQSIVDGSETIEQLASLITQKHQIDLDTATSDSREFVSKLFELIT